MDYNNWRPATVMNSTVDDWRTELQPSTRQRIINMIIETLKKHLPIDGPEGKIDQIAVKFEEETLSVATSQSDYLRIISSKMLMMETNGIPNYLNLSTFGSENPQDPAFMHPQQAHVLHVQQHPDLPQQQQKLNALSLQQNQLTGQSNVQQQEQQQQRWLNQLNNIEQHLLGDDIPQQQQLGQQCSMSGFQNHQHQQQPMHTTHQPPEQQNSQVSANILQTQSQDVQSQLAQQQQLMSERLSQTTQMLQRFQQQTSANGPLSTDAAITGNVVDVQEEIYQKIQSMREKYLPDLSDIHRRISQKCQQHDSLPQPTESELIERLKLNTSVIEKMMGFLNLPKNCMHPSLKDKLDLAEKKILHQLRSQQQPNSQQRIQTSANVSWSTEAAIAGATETGSLVDVQEEIYQKIQSMREKYLPDLSDIHQRISQKCQQHDSLPQPIESELIERLKLYNSTVEKMMVFLNLPKSCVQPSFKDKLALIEKQILDALARWNHAKKPGPQHQQVQPTGGHPLFVQQQHQWPQQPQQQIQPTVVSHPLSTHQQQQLQQLEQQFNQLQQQFTQLQQQIQS